MINKFNLQEDFDLTLMYEDCILDTITDILSAAGIDYKIDHREYVNPQSEEDWGLKTYIAVEFNTKEDMILAKLLLKGCDEEFYNEDIYKGLLRIM